MEEGSLFFPAVFRTANEENFFPVFTLSEINLNRTLSPKETPTRTFTLLPHDPHPTNSSANILGGKMSLPIVPKQISV